MNLNQAFANAITEVSKEKNISLIEAQFDTLKQSKHLSKIFLSNGIGLTSPVLGYDDTHLILENGNGDGMNLVSRHFIATVQVMSRQTETKVNVKEGVSLVEQAMAELKNENVCIFLVNGIKLTGMVEMHDGDGLMLMPIHEKGTVQVVRWDSIASISKLSNNFNK